LIAGHFNFSPLLLLVNFKADFLKTEHGCSNGDLMGQLIIGSTGFVSSVLNICPNFNYSDCLSIEFWKANFLYTI